MINTLCIVSPCKDDALAVLDCINTKHPKLFDYYKCIYVYYPDGNQDWDEYEKWKSIVHENYPHSDIFLKDNDSQSLDTILIWSTSGSVTLIVVDSDKEVLDRYSYKRNNIYVKTIDELFEYATKYVK